MSHPNTETDAAMREEFERLWTKTIVPMIAKQLNDEQMPDGKKALFVACWIAYCVGTRAVKAPE